MQNFRKLPAMKRKIAGASNKLGKMNEMIEKIEYIKLKNGDYKEVEDLIQKVKEKINEL